MEKLMDETFEIPKIENADRYIIRNNVTQI